MKTSSWLTSVGFFEELEDLVLWCENLVMIHNTLTELLRLPAAQRLELALALWNSLDEDQRAAELVLTSEQEAELDRRLADHLAHPESATSWEEVRRKLTGGA